MDKIVKGDRILTQIIESKEKTRNGIIIPEMAKVKNQIPKAKVIAIGDTVTEVKIGELVYFLEHAGSDIVIDDVDYKVLRQDDIILKDK